MEGDKMEEDKRDELYELIDNIPITPENIGIIERIKEDIARR